MMKVICKNNEDVENLLKVDNYYFVEKIVCQENQFYYQIEGFNRLFVYHRFYPVDLIREEKLNDLGI